jgi:hypothetical protein
MTKMSPSGLTPEQRELMARQFQRLLRAVHHWRRTNKMRVWYSHGTSPKVTAKSAS